MDIILYIILCVCLVGLEENCQGVGLYYEVHVCAYS